MNKRGQGLSTNAMVLIILAIVVLVILIMGFTIGWSKFSGFLGGGDNVDTIATQCGIACSTQSVFGFCAKERELNTGEESFTDNCNNFATGDQYADKLFGIKECGNLCSQ